MRGPIALDDWRLLQLTSGRGPFGEISGFDNGGRHERWLKK